MNSLPILTTKETIKLRDDYPSIEHLEAGNAAGWMMERQDQLLIRAKEERAGMNLAKFLNLGAAAVGAVCYATSPLALIGAIVAGAGYVWTIAQDLNDTHQFAPIPFLRGNIFEFLSAMGDSEAREEYFAEKNELADLMFHLEPMERYEFVILKHSSHILTNYLTQVEQGKRFYAYRWILDWFIQLKGNFPTPEQLQEHLATVTADTRVNYQQVNAIKEATSNTQLGIPAARFAPLPGSKVAQLPNLVNDTITPQNSYTASTNRASKFEVINHLVDKIQNCFIVGLPGSGKDFLVSHATHEIKKVKPTICLFLIDCKNDQKEYGYYKHFDYVERILDWSCDAYEFVTWFKKVWLKYEDVANQCEREGCKILVIINEGTRSGQCFSQERDPFIKGKLTAITSSGDSRGRNIWIMVQAPQLEDLGFGDTVRSQLFKVAILHESNVGAISNWWKTNCFGKQLKPEQLFSLIGDSPRARTVYSGKTMQWYPMPELENFSGYDRDKGEFLPGFKSLENSDKQVNDSKVVTKVQIETEIKTLTDTQARLLQLLDNIPEGLEALLKRFGISDNAEHKRMLIKSVREVAAIADRLDLLEKFEL
ncbi:MAG: hypothetical protein ACYTXI_39065 [Nostoc sp.]